jgi:hypothetical protein
MSKGVSVAVLATFRLGVGLSLASVLLAACGHSRPVLDSTSGPSHAGDSTTKLETQGAPSTPAALGRRSRESPPCPPVHELSYIVGVHLHATGARAHVSGGVVSQRCTYAPPRVEVAGETGGHPEARFSFRIPALRGAATVEAAYAHFTLVIDRSPGTESPLPGATLVREPLFGSGAFLLRVPGPGPARCEVVEANGNGQPIGVTVSAVRRQPRPLTRLCREAVAAAHMLP